MGARLSQPRGPAGMVESSLPTKPGPQKAPTPAQPFARRPLNSRMLVAPAAAATMALLLFVYARTSIRAAKANAQRYREADGGDGVNLLNESRRRHGVERRLEQGGVVRQLAGEVKREWSEGSTTKENRKKKENDSGGAASASAAVTRSAEEEKLKQLLGK